MLNMPKSASGSGNGDQYSGIAGRTLRIKPDTQYPQIRPEYTAGMYGPYLRVVRIGLYAN